MRILRLLAVLFFFTLNCYAICFASEKEIISLNQKSTACRTTDSKKAIELSLTAVKLAGACKDNALRALSYKNLGVALYYDNAYNEALKSYEKALEFYTELEDSAGISACLNNEAIIYKDLNSLNKSLLYYTKALAIDKKLNDKQNLAITYNNIGEIYHLQGKYLMALQCYFTSLNYEQSLMNFNGMADCFLNMGAVMEENNLFDTALNFYKKALYIYEDVSNKYRLGQCYNNMGVNYSRLKNFYEAKDCFKKSLEIKSSINDAQGKVTTLINLGNLFILLNDTAKAKACFIEAIYYDDNEAFKALQKIEKDKNTSPQEADDYFFYWISYNIEQGNYNEIAQNLFYKGFIHYNLGEYAQAIGYFTNSLEIATYQNLHNTLKDNYLYLSKSYQFLDDFKKAHYYLQQYTNLSDSINSTMIDDFLKLNIKTGHDFELNYTPEKKVKSSKDIFENIWFISTLVLSVLLAIMSYKIILKGRKL